MINRLTRLGCEVIHDGFEHVHTTGHAQREELQHLYEALLPEWYLPVEGEHRMLRRNADLAIELVTAEPNYRCQRWRPSHHKCRWAPYWWSHSGALPLPRRPVR